MMAQNKATPIQYTDYLDALDFLAAKQRAALQSLATEHRAERKALATEHQAERKALDVDLLRRRTTDTVSIFCTARCSQCGRLGPAILLKESCGGYGDVAAFYCATGDDAQAVYDRLGCAARQKKETP